MVRVSTLITTHDGALEHQNIVQVFDTLEDKIDKRFDAIEMRLDAIEKSLGEIKNPVDLETGETCCICLDPLVHIHKTPLVRSRCPHMYHEACGTNLLTALSSCPLCRTPFTVLYKVDHPKSLRGLQIRHRQAARNRSASARAISTPSSTHQPPSGSYWQRLLLFRRSFS